jgi:molybdopterin/thiamine biosynthesis adenylyltransferase/rhodanese-related sulfurtransferase
MSQVLSHEDIRRYSRHLLIPQIGLNGQRRLKEASVLCIGAGGLGSPLTMYLAAAGVGKIGLVDFDEVDYSNLQRQILYGVSDVGKPKLESASKRLMEINEDIEVVTYQEMFTSGNALKICDDYDVIVDGTDNFPTRYLTNDVCVLLRKPNVYASILRFEGQASVFLPGEGPCYRCLYPEPPPLGVVPSCGEAGVLGVLPGVMGLIQATETIKLILGIGHTLVGRLLLYNALDMTFKEMKLERDPECPVCGEEPSIRELIDYERFCGLGNSGRSTHTSSDYEITPTQLFNRLCQEEKPLVIDVREPNEWEIYHLPFAVLMPERELPQAIQNIHRSQEIVLYCRTGVRSLRAASVMKEMGFKNVKSLSGGINRWSDDVDSSTPKY